jgi:lipoyl-dependent peroxiredoxin
MPVHVLYRTEVRATGGRDGLAVTDDGNLDIVLTTPKELGGTDAPGINPEQLFAAAYSACFLTHIKYVANQDGQRVPEDATVTATVGVGPRSEGGFGLEVQLAVSLPGLPPSDADALMRLADLLCPYSHALRGNVPVHLVVV